MLKTPKNRITVILIAATLYITAPMVEWFFYSTELDRGHFAVTNDSIGLPFSIFMRGWLLGMPFAALLIWLALCSYPGRVSLISFNGARLYWSIFWSLLFAVPVFYSFFFAIESVYRLEPLDVLQSFLSAYLLLCLRSSIIYSGLFQVKDNRVSTFYH